MNKISIKAIVLFMVGTLFMVSVNAQQTITIAVLFDGPIEREILPLNQVVKEVIELNAGDFNIEFPERYIKNGAWNRPGIQKQLQHLLNDPNVDLIITYGLLASHEAAKIEQLTKPVIAPIVADRVLQNLPYQNGRSGKRNYVYISSGKTVQDDLRQFYELMGFNHLAIVVDQLFLEALPELKSVAYAVQEELGFELTLIPVVNDPEQALNQLTTAVDALYVTPLLRFDEDDFKRFAQRLIELKLPSFSLLGRDELKMGLLATATGRDIDTIRTARRIALDIQSILLGTKPAELNVDLEKPAKLAINMKTARAIGFSPKWQFLEIADLLNEESDFASNTISLIDAIDSAIASNLSLQVDRMELDLAVNETAIARSNLLPQINIGVGVSQIDKDRAGFLQSENSSDADIDATQIIYSEQIMAGYQIAQLLQQAQSSELKTQILDTISSSATAYIQLLLAYARETIRISNLKVTETNLELAQARLKIGYSDKADVLRWQSQIASDRQNLYTARAARRQAATQLKQILNFSLTEEIAVTENGITELLLLLDNPRFQRFFDNPLSFDVFTEFEVERALNNAPELEQLDYLLASNERQVKAAKRAYYIPDVSLSANYGQNVSRGGAARNAMNLQDDEWSVGVQATIPLFAGGVRQAEVAKANNTLTQTRYQQDAIRQQVETRVRTALQKSSGSYPAIRLSKDAESAAEQNLLLVIDSYSKGVLSITDLINAQDAALAARLSAAEAQFNFMIDWIEIQRAIANFDILLTTDGLENWYRELDAYFTIRNQ